MWMSAEDEAYRTRAVADHDLRPDGLQRELEAALSAAATRWRTPRATVTIIEGRRQFFPARLGMEAAETDRAASICDVIARSGELLLTADARCDPRLWNHPAVTGPPDIRFYAGAPLRLESEAPPIGALCVLDTRPKLDIDAADALLLLDLAALVSRKLADRRGRGSRRHPPRAA